MLDLVIKGGTLVSEDGERDRVVAIANGQVAAILQSGEIPTSKEVIDASGMLVFPGLVDSHVHFREPGLTHKEDFASGSRAAAAGGVTTVMVMPTDNPFTLTVEDFEAKRAIGEGRVQVDFALQAGLGPDLSHVQGLAEAGAISFEIFMSDLPTNLLTADAADLVQALEAVRNVGGVAGVTPGNDSLFKRAAELALRAYGADAKAFPVSRPPEAEALGIAQACIAASASDARMHLRQVSSAVSLKALRALRTELTTAEVTPHNLALSEDDYLRLGVVAKVAPPLRPTSDVEALQDALAAGELDTIGTDHAPHHRAEKAAGLHDIWKAPGGFPGVQTFLAVMLHLVERGVLDRARVVKLCCANPARIFGLYPRKGALTVGSDADLVIVDPHASMMIRNENQLSKAGQTPFAGLSVKAKLVLALLRGNVVMRDGQPAGSAAGRFLRPML